MNHKTTLWPSSPIMTNGFKAYRDSEMVRVPITSSIISGRGTIVFTFSGCDVTPLEELGLSPIKFTGTGTIVLVFEQTTAWLFVNGCRFIKIIDFITSPISYLTISNGSQIIRDFSIFPFCISDVEAASLAGGEFEISGFENHFLFAIADDYYQLMEHQIPEKLGG